MTQTELIFGLISLGLTLGSGAILITWKFATVKSELEEKLAVRLDNLETQLNTHTNTALQTQSENKLIQAGLKNDISRVNDRVTNLHSNIRAKIKGQDDTMNKIIEVLHNSPVDTKRIDRRVNHGTIPPVDEGDDA